MPHWDPRSLQPTAERRFCLKVDTRRSHCCQKLPCGPRDSVWAVWDVATFRSVGTAEEEIGSQDKWEDNGQVKTGDWFLLDFVRQTVLL